MYEVLNLTIWSQIKAFVAKPSCVSEISCSTEW